MKCKQCLYYIDKTEDCEYGTCRSNCRQFADIYKERVKQDKEISRDIAYILEIITYNQ